MRELAALSGRHNTHIERQDYHAGLICAVLANINRDPKKTKPFQPADFMPRATVEESQERPHEALDDLLALGAALGAKVKVHRGA